MKILTYHKIKASFSEWSPVYLKIAQTVIESVDTEQFELVHIGSTAFKVGGKGIIDFMVLYKDDNVEQAVEYLLSRGFQKQISDTPFPPQRPRLDGAVLFDNTIYYLHMHVIAYESTEHKEKLQYNSYMLNSHKARTNYENAKKEVLAKGITEQEQYGKHKSPFVKAILQQIQ